MPFPNWGDVTVGSFWEEEMLHAEVNNPHIYAYMGIWAALIRLSESL